MFNSDMKTYSEADQALLQRIDQALESIRPYLEADGGNVKVVELTEDKVVRLELLGACGSCPMSAMTFRAGIEEAIRREVPSIQSVEAINLTPAGPTSE
jgi:Fe-S cluster biogenesis protein NfuA